MKRYYPTDPDVSALLALALPAFVGVAPAPGPARMPLRPLVQAAARPRKHRRATGSAARRARVKLWVLFPDGGTFDTYQRPGHSIATATAYWEARLSPGGAWHTKGFVMARIYTAAAPGQFGDAAFRTIYP